MGHKWSEHYLSGVGLSTDPDFSIWTAPRNADARYDDRNYKASARDNIHPRTPVFTRMTGGPIVIDPDQPAIEDEPWGFLVHDSCWSLFQSVLQPWVVPVGVFVEFCRSCPWSFGFLNWGHDYGGIVTFKFDPSDLLTGEDKSIDGYKEALPGFRHHIAALSMFADPYKIPELLLCLAETNRTALNDVDAPAHSACIAAIRDRPECFLQLPPEISEAIVLQLKSTDLCNLRLASRAFAAMPLPQAFWASRFQSGFEFESVIEVQSTSFRQQNRDWKMLYHRVKALLATPSLSNRNRIWGILRPLADLLKCYSSLSLAGYAYPSFYDPDVPKSHDHPWTCIQGAVERPKGYFFGGCMVLFERTVSIPRDMTGLHVSVVHFSGTHYISGLRFVRQHGGDVCIGYNIPDNEVLLSLDGNSQSDSFGGVKGFEVAVGRRGIHAIALVSSTGIMSAWAGHPEEAPQMRLRTRLDRISALKAGFDVSGHCI